LRTTYKRSQPKHNELTFFRHPASTLGPVELEALFSRLGQAAERDFPAKLTELQVQLRAFNGELVLNSLAFFCLPGFVAVGGEVDRNSAPIEQYHLELLQALYLATDPHSSEDRPTTPAATQVIADLVVDAHTAFQQKRFSELLRAQSGAERRQALVREQLRGVTQIVRNWAYVHDVFQIMREWAAPLDQLSRDCIGFTFTELLDLIQAVLDQQSHAMQRHFMKLSRVGRSRSKKSLARRYADEFLDPASGPNEMHALLTEYPQFTRKTLWYFLAEHSNQYLDDVFRFSAQQIEGRLRRRGRQLDASPILASLSIAPGSLRDSTIEHFFLDNPVWARPIMAMGQNTYSAPLAQVLLHGVWHAVRRIAAVDTRLEGAVQRRRAVYLEEATAELFRKAFAGAQVLANSLYGPALEYENDLLIIVGEFALVVEAKSAVPRAVGLRGGMESFRTTIAELITDPLVQTERFATCIRGLHGVTEFPRRGGGTNRADFSGVRYVLRLGVILEDIASIHAVTAQLQTAGFVASDVRLAPILTLADLRVLFDILETPSQKLHYFWRRQRLESAIDLVTDELDLLGLYLQTAFNVGSLDDQPMRLALTGMSATIDSYYERRRIGFRPRKPRLLLSQWWNAILSRLATERPSRWLELSVKLLHVSPDEQRRAYRRVRRLTTKVANRAPYASTDSNALMLFSGNANRRDAFVFLAYRSHELASRNQWMQNVGTQALREPGIGSVVVIAICVDRNDWPYSAMGVFSMESADPWLSDLKLR
jgi:hypothetical protein